MRFQPRCGLDATLLRGSNLTATSFPLIAPRMPLKPRLLRRSVIPGTLLLVGLAAGLLSDLWFAVDPENPGLRFWPQTIRLAFIAVMCGYTSSHLARLFRLNIVRFQAVWLLVMIGRLLFQPDFDRPQALYVAYYTFWIVVFWTVYCMVDCGRLNVKQVAVVGTLMNALMSSRVLLFIFSGVWIGSPVLNLNLNGRVTDQGYILLWFTLMQLAAPIGLVGGMVAVTSMIAVVLTLERGTLISLLVGLLVYATIQAYLVPRHRKRILIWSFSSLAVVGITMWMSADRILARWLDLSNSKTAGSGRLTFWSEITNNWVNSDLFTKIFGFGPLSVQNVVGTTAKFAHNDFLEQLQCFGLLGALLFIGVCCAMLRTCYQLVRNRSGAASVFCAATAVFISTGLYCVLSDSMNTVWFSVIAATMLAYAKYPARKAVRRTSGRRFPIYAGPLPAASLTG